MYNSQVDKYGFPFIAPEPFAQQPQIPRLLQPSMPITYQRTALDPLITLRNALTSSELSRHHPKLVQELVSTYHRYLALCRRVPQKTLSAPYHIGLCTECPAAHCYLY